MCRADKSFDPFAESTVDGIIAGAVTVKVCQIKTESKDSERYNVRQNLLSVNGRCGGLMGSTLDRLGLSSH